MSNRSVCIILVCICVAVVLVGGCTSSSNGSATPASSASGQATAASPASTPAVAASPGASTSQDPIIGKWTITFAQGGSAQVVFNADGSFAGYLNGGSQAQRSGTWQDIGGGKYTVTITGQASPANWVYNANTDMAYNSAYPALGYSRVS